MSDGGRPDLSDLHRRADRAVAEFKTGSISRALELMEGVRDDLAAVADGDGPEGETGQEAESDVWTCPECDREFTTPQGLNSHQRIHTDAADDQQEDTDNE